VETVRATEPPRWVRILLCATALAVGWIALSLAFGLGATASHAGDDRDGRGLLGALVDAAQEVADPLPDAVSSTLEGVASTVGTVADTTIDTVVEAEPVSRITGAVVSTVRDVPVVGKVADDLGVTDALDGVGDAVTEVVAGVGHDVGDAVDAVTETVTPPAPVPPTPVLPAAPPPRDGGPAPDPSDEDSATVVDDTAATDVAAVAAPGRVPSSSPAALAPAAGDAGVGVALIPSERPLPPPPPLRALPSTALTSSGAAGASTAAGIVPSSPSPFAHHAWLRAPGDRETGLPPDPPSAPDVSPD